MKKNFKITYLKKSQKFLDKNRVITENEIDDLIIKFVKKHFYSVDINIDYKALQGNLQGFFRIRKGNIRIIIQYSIKKVRKISDFLITIQILYFF